MAQVRIDITMSLDGFVATPGIGPEHPLGVGGDPLHDWLFHGVENDPTGVDAQMRDEFFALSGAFIIGRRTFDLGEEPWGDDGAFGRPCFVLTHRPRDMLVKGPTTFTFVSDGPASALAQARTAAGERDVCVMGGAEAIQHYLAAGQVDQLDIHIANLLLGAGTRLFEPSGRNPVSLKRTRLLVSPYATHLRFRVNKEQ